MKKTRLISLLLTIVMFLSLVNCQNIPQNNIQELGSKKDFKVNTLYYDDDGDVTEPIEEACAEGYTGACELKKLLEDKKQAKNNPNDPNKPKTKPTPKPKPSPSDECKDSKSISPSQLQLAPTGFSTMSFHTKNFTVDTITDNINYLIEKTEMAKVYKIKYDGFLADKTTDPAKLSELKKQLDDEIAERDLITQQVLQGLNDYKVSLRNQVNTLMGDPNYSEEEGLNFRDLNDYKDITEIYNEDLISLTKNKNTVSTLNSYGVLANEVEMLISLIKKYIDNSISDLIISGDFLQNLEINKINKSDQLINYLSKQILYHKSTIDVTILNLRNDMKEYQDKILELTNSIKEIELFLVDSNFKITSFNILDDDSSDGKPINARMIISIRNPQFANKLPNMSIKQLQIQEIALKNKISNLEKNFPSRKGDIQLEKSKLALTKDQLKESFRLKSNSETKSQICPKTFPTKEGAFKQIKLDLGIPKNQLPDKQAPIYYDKNGDIKDNKQYEGKFFRKVPMLDDNSNPIIKNGKTIETREYDYKLPNGKIATIQDHSEGHEKGGQPPHYNVRPYGDPTGKLDGAKEHYYFKK